MQLKRVMNKTCHFNMTEEENFKNICNLTTDVMGFKDGELSVKSRKRPLQIARAVAAYIGLKEENIHRNIVAKCQTSSIYRSNKRKSQVHYTNILL